MARPDPGARCAGERRHCGLPAVVVRQGRALCSECDERRREAWCDVGQHRVDPPLHCERCGGRRCRHTGARRACRPCWVGMARDAEASLGSVDLDYLDPDARSAAEQLARRRGCVDDD